MQIIPLEELKHINYHEAGGKAKGLAELIKSGLKIARGFVIIGLKTEEDYESAAEYYIGSPFDSVAVRSSATNEDGDDFSNAGQFVSLLNVSGKTEFISALKSCMDSLSNNNAESYSAFFSLGTKQAEMSIVVQEMVSARCAGVCFSFDPITKKNNYIIEAVLGLGESLVSGTASAERHVVPCPDSAQNVQPFAAKSGILTTEDLSKLTAQIKVAVDHFNKPLDMEYAIDASGELFWLQARPITTLKEATLDELDSAHLPSDIFTSCNVGEMLPGAVTPLSLSTSVRAIDYGLRDMLITAGVYKNMQELPSGSCISSFSNQLFFNFTPLYKMGSSVMMCNASQVERAICGQELNVPIPSFKQKSKFRKFINGIKYVGFVFGRKRAVRKATRLAERFNIPVTGDVSKDYQTITDSIKHLNKSLTYHYQTSSHSGAMNSTLAQIIVAEVKDEDKANAIIASLLVEINDIESVDILRALRKLAGAVLEVKPDANTLSYQELNEFIKNSNGKVKEAYDYFLKRHGHRAIREAELRSHSWRNDNKALMEYVKTVMSSGNIVEIKTDDSFEANLVKYLDGKKAGAKLGLKYVIKQARAGVKNREFTKSKFIKVTDEFKIAYDKLAENLVLLGALPEKDLVYFFTHEELGELINHKKASLIKHAMQRKRLLSEQQAAKFNKVTIGKPQPIEQARFATKSGTVLNGTPISRGNVSGKARVIRTADDAMKLEKGEIMVASFTDIGWSPYYCLVGGLITEIGSALSHGAVVAREYALPLVVNVSNATSIIKTGDEIALNATQGTITIIKH